MRPLFGPSTSQQSLLFLISKQSCRLVIHTIGLGRKLFTITMETSGLGRHAERHSYGSVCKSQKNLQWPWSMYRHKNIATCITICFRKSFAKSGMLRHNNPKMVCTILDSSWVDLAMVLSINWRKYCNGVTYLTEHNRSFRCM